MSKAKRVIEEAKSSQNLELDLVEKNITSLEQHDLQGLFALSSITRLTLSHNKLQSLPASIANFLHLEILNLFNNQIEDLPTSISSLPKLRVLSLGMNRLNSLPRGFGSFPVLEVLDLSYNNLNEGTLPGNFFMLETLRALYLSDNDFESLPSDIGKLKNLQILALRDNDLLTLPREIGELTRLRELHLQGNRLTVLPPELGALDMLSLKSDLRLDNNPWIVPIADQLMVGVSHVIDYIRSETYKHIYAKNQNVDPIDLPPRSVDKSKKISRKQGQEK